MATTRAHRLRLAPVALAALALASSAACTATVGDACEVQADCGTELYCERSLPDGYCTQQRCEVDGCPDLGVCITFYYDAPVLTGAAGSAPEPTSYESFCMASCASNGDCRDGYVCLTGYGPHPFCHDERAEVPESWPAE